MTPASPCKRLSTRAARDIKRFEEERSPAVQVVIPDLSHAHELRFTALRALEWLAGDLACRGVRLRLAGVSQP